MKKPIKKIIGLCFLCLPMLFTGCDEFSPNTMVQLTDLNEIGASNPVWYKSGDTIVFSGFGEDGKGLWTLDPDGNNLEILLDVKDMDPPPIYVYPWDYSDDGYILFTDDGSNLPSNIYYLPSDGGKPTLILQGARPTVKGNLDGIYNIAYYYRFQDKGVSGIYLSDIHGSEPQFVVEGDFIYNPHWSPDGNKLTYTRLIYPSYRYELCIYDFDSQSETVIYETQSGDMRCPRWSPDGQYIAFSMYCDGTSKSEVCIIPTYGGEPIRLTEFPYDPGVDLPGAVYLSWSPDSKWIVFDIIHNELWKVSVEY